MRILFLSPDQSARYNRGHQLFRNEIGRQHEVLYYGDGFPNFNDKLTVRQIINRYCEWTPDVIMTYGWRYSQHFRGLGKIKNIAKIHITVDYGRKVGIPRQNKFFANNKYDLVFAISQNAYRLMTKNKVCNKIRIIPFSADTNVYKPVKVKRQNMVLASFSTRKDIYPRRSRVQKVIKSMKIPVITKRVIHGSLIKAINKCKITVTSNNIFKSLSMRYTETLACGGFLLADKPEDLEFVGFVDGKHLVIYDTMQDLKDKVK